MLSNAITLRSPEIAGEGSGGNYWQDLMTADTRGARTGRALTTGDSGGNLHVTEPTPDYECFAIFLEDAQSLDPTIRVHSARRVWMELPRIRTFGQLLNADLCEDEWRILQLAVRAFFMREGRMSAKA